MKSEGSKKRSVATFPRAASCESRKIMNQCAGGAYGKVACCTEAIKAGDAEMLEQKALRIVVIERPVIQRARNPSSDHSRISFCRISLLEFSGRTSSLGEKRVNSSIAFCQASIAQKFRCQKIRGRKVHECQTNALFRDAEASQVIVILRLQEHFFHNGSGSQDSRDFPVDQLLCVRGSSTCSQMAILCPFFIRRAI